MSVLINELEIVPPPEEVAEAEGETPQDGRRDQAETLRAKDVLTLVRRRERRRIRVWAH